MKHITILIMLLTGMLSGCIDESLYGTYTNGSSSLVLQQGGTYLYYSDLDHAPQKGQFTQNGQTLQLTNVLGMTTILNITKDGLVDDDGEIWVKV